MSQENKHTQPELFADHAIPADAVALSQLDGNVVTEIHRIVDMAEARGAISDSVFIKYGDAPQFEDRFERYEIGQGNGPETLYNLRVGIPEQDLSVVIAPDEVQPGNYVVFVDTPHEGRVLSDHEYGLARAWLIGEQSNLAETDPVRAALYGLAANALDIDEAQHIPRLLEQAYQVTINPAIENGDVAFVREKLHTLYLEVAEGVELSAEYSVEVDHEPGSPDETTEHIKLNGLVLSDGKYVDYRSLGVDDDLGSSVERHMRVDDPSDSPDIDMATMKQLIEEARNGNVHQVLAGHPELVRKFFAGFWQELVKAQIADRERKTQRKLGGTASGPNVFQLPES